MTTHRPTGLLSSSFALGLSLALIGCGQQDSTDPATDADAPAPGTDAPQTDHADAAESNEDNEDNTTPQAPLIDKSIKASTVLDEAFFIDPVSTTLREQAVYEDLTGRVATMIAPSLSEKNLQAYLFEVQIDNQWWVDSVHDHHSTAFARQERLLSAGLLKPEQCRSRTVFLKTEE